MDRGKTVVSSVEGVIAILRGVAPSNVLSVAKVLIDAGLKAIEVPLNSPDPLLSIRLLNKAYGDRLIVGAGTVLSESSVDAVADAGAQLVLSPNMSPGVIRRTKALGLFSMPGVATPSEGFEAQALGADALKLFPCEMIQPAGLSAWRAVFPPDTKFFAVGGITDENVSAYRLMGAAGVGAGSSLFHPSLPLDILGQRARALLDRWNSSTGQRA